MELNLAYRDSTGENTQIRVLQKARSISIFAAINLLLNHKINFMKLKVTIYTTLLAGLAALSSCNKDDNNNNNNGNPNSGNLTAGQCTISFNTDKDFNGTTSINIVASNTTFANKSTTGNRDQLTLQAVNNQISGTTAKITTAQLAIHVPTGSTTSGGNLSGNFNGNGDVVANIMISNLNAGQSTPAYNSESGTITITKLNASELEGTFTAKCINESENTSINLSNGKFAAKFK